MMGMPGTGVEVAKKQLPKKISLIFMDIPADYTEKALRYLLLCNWCGREDFTRFTSSSAANSLTWGNS